MNILLVLFFAAVSAAPKVHFPPVCTQSKFKSQFEKPDYVYSKAKKQKTVLKVDVCGQVLAPKSFVFKRLLDFEQYKQINSFVDSVVVDGKKVSVKASILGKTLKSKLIWQKKSDSIAFFHVIDGAFKGMKIYLKLVDLERRRSMVVMRAFYKYNNSKFPDVFIESAALAVAKQLARNMKNWVSLDYKKQLEGFSGGKS